MKWLSKWFPRGSYTTLSDIEIAYSSKRVSVCRSLIDSDLDWVSSFPEDRREVTTTTTTVTADVYGYLICEILLRSFIHHNSSGKISIISTCVSILLFMTVRYYGWPPERLKLICNSECSDGGRVRYNLNEPSHIQSCVSNTCPVGVLKEKLPWLGILGSSISEGLR